MTTRAPDTLRQVLEGSSLVVLVGDGGVGKTSVSAAVAYGLACGGEDVGVLTVDPAPRLGDALGVPAIDADPKQVRLPAGAAGSLTAMRLDTQRTFDRLVAGQAPSPEAAAALLSHPIYRAISQQLGGTDSYMAFQRLHELLERQSPELERAAHDVLVVDTPPAASAAQLLSAPARLSGLMETGALSILAQPALIAARASSRIARVTISVLLAAVERVTGASLQREIADFVGLFSELVGGLEDRARRIDALLRAPSTAFVLVTRARRGDVAAALAFHSQLARSGIGVAAVVVNRVLPGGSRVLPGGSRVLPGGADGSRSLADLPKRLHAAVRRMEADIAAVRALELEAIAELRSAISAAGGCPVLVLEDRDVDVTTLEDIAALAAALGF